MALRWIDLTADGGDEDARDESLLRSDVPRPRPSSSPRPSVSHTSLPMRRLASEESARHDVRRTLTEHLSRLSHASEDARRSLASTRLSLLGNDAPGSPGVPSARESDACAAALRASPSPEALGAMLQRVRLGCARVSSASAAGGEVGRALEALVRGAELLSREESHFAQQAKAVNAELFREARRRIGDATRVLVSETAEETRSHRVEEEAVRQRMGEVERRAAETVLMLRDAALEGEAMAQMREVAAELVAASRSLSRTPSLRSEFLQTPSLRSEFLQTSGSLSSSSGVGDVEGAAGAFSRHADSLQSAFSPPDVRHAAECVRLAGEELLGCIPSLVELAEGGPGAGRVPPALLSRVRRQERRRELATMDPSRAALLLSHTRQAKAQMDPSSDEFGKLAVVEEILSIRAASGSSPLARRLWRLHEVWELRRGEFEGSLRKVENAAALAEQIRERAERESGHGSARRRALLAESQRRRVADLQAWAAAREASWAELSRREFAASASRIIQTASSLASRVASALQILLPLLAEESAAEEGEEDTGGAAGTNARGRDGETFGSTAEVLSRRRLREAASALLGEEEDEKDADRAEEGAKELREGAAARGMSVSAPAPSSSAARAAAVLPARAGVYTSLHTHLLAAFELWVDRAAYVVHKNAQGTILAARSIVSRLASEQGELRRALSLTLEKTSSSAAAGDPSGSSSFAPSRSNSFAPSALGVPSAAVSSGSSDVFF